MSLSSGLRIPNSKKSAFVIGLTLALILLGGTVSLLSTVAATNPTFSPAINLSNDTGNAKDATVSNSGQNVYVAWTEGSKGILFRMSSDGGVTWTPPTTQPALRLSPKGGVAQFPVMFTQFEQINAGDVYVTWAQTVAQANGSKILQIFVAASTNNGVSFTTTQVSHNSTNNQDTPAIAAQGSDVYVSWFSAKNSAGRGTIYVSSSTSNGTSWSSPIDAVNPSSAGESEIVASGSNAYVAVDGIYFSATYDHGISWSPQFQVFATPLRTNTSVYYGREPWITASGNFVYITWEANSTTPGIKYHDQFRTSIDGGLTWGPVQNVTDPLKDNWEPEIGAYGSNVFMTFHSLATNGIYVTSSIGVNSSTPIWSTAQLLSPTRLTSSFGHVFTSDGVNVFVIWGQQVSASSSVWNAYVSYSGNSGSTWSTPIDISNNAAGVAAGNQDVTLFALSSNGIHCFAAWTYVNGSSQIYFASS